MFALIRSPSEIWMGPTLSLAAGVCVLISFHFSVMASRRSLYSFTFTLYLERTSRTSSSWSRRMSVSFFTDLISRSPAITLSKLAKLAESAAGSSVSVSAACICSICFSSLASSCSVLPTMNLTKPCFSAMASGSMDCTLSKRADPWVRFIANSFPATSEDPMGWLGGHSSGSASYKLTHSIFCVSSTSIEFLLLLVSFTPPYSISWLGLNGPNMALALKSGLTSPLMQKSGMSVRVAECGSKLKARSSSRR
mmetsp:Transcript_24996/g.41819  ORF Transcript_24996/g.41819 Transcript_24996/m.41819 type:complete len:252 (+) Transcript_24996:9336-10091(+)